MHASFRKQLHEIEKTGQNATYTEMRQIMHTLDLSLLGLPCLSSLLQPPEKQANIEVTEQIGEPDHIIIL